MVTLALMAVAAVAATQTAAAPVTRGDPGPPIQFSRFADGDVAISGQNADNLVRIRLVGSGPSAEIQVETFFPSGETRYVWASEPYPGTPHIYVDLRNGNDRFEAETGFPQSELAVSVGTGDDRLDAVHVDRAYAGPGDDVVVGSGGGGPGDDKFKGTNGSDEMRAGADADTLVGAAGGDLLNGGPGQDKCAGGAPHGQQAQQLPLAQRDRAVKCEAVTGVP